MRGRSVGVFLAAGASFLAVEWGQLSVAFPNLGLPALVLLLVVAGKQWLPHVLVGMILVFGCLLPIEFLLPGDIPHGFTPLMQRVAVAVSAAGVVARITYERLPMGVGVFVLLLGAIVWVHPPKVAAFSFAEATQLELEDQLVKGWRAARPWWIERALQTNAGPSLMRRVCAMRLHQGPPHEGADALIKQTQTVCKALGTRLPEEGASMLVDTGTPSALRLAVDLWVAAGDWQEASLAAKRAMAAGDIFAAQNLYQWRQLKGQARRRVSHWDGWNAQMRRATDGGFERSGMRVSGAPGKLLPHRVALGQTALTPVTRYPGSFTVDLPSPPEQILPRAFRLHGRAGPNFQIEILDATRQWHLYGCHNDPAPPSFCTKDNGIWHVVPDEEVEWPLRLIRLRGEFSLSELVAVEPG